MQQKDVKKEMLLLGAGASVEADVPGAYDMTKRIIEQLPQNYQHVINFVVGGLLFQQGIQGQSPLAGQVNVEELFNAVQLLAERNSLEAAPFVGSWHAMVQEFDKARSAPPQLNHLYNIIYESVTNEILRALPSHPPAFQDAHIDRELDQLVEKKAKAIANGSRGASPSFHGVGRRIGDYMMCITKDWMNRLKSRRPSNRYVFETVFQESIEQMQERPGDGEIFKETAESMIRTLANIVWIDGAERVKHLKPLLSLAKAQTQLTIATLNYDNAIELLASSNGIPCSTGIENWSSSGSFAAPAKGILLLKLHGSIDWAREKAQSTSDGPMPHTIVHRVSPEKLKESGFRPAVIFGQRNKLTAEGPFLDLLRAFQQELSGSQQLTVVGYSFRDAHVNEYLARWLNASRHNKMRIVTRAFDQSTNIFAKHLTEFCVGQVELITGDAGPRLSELYGSGLDQFRPATSTS